MLPSRRRILTTMPAWPLLGPAAALAQANINAPTGGPAREQGGEVQAGAGTLGDVTTGSSGGSADASAASARPAGGRGASADARRADGEEGVRGSGGRDPAAARRDGASR